MSFLKLSKIVILKYGRRRGSLNRHRPKQLLIKKWQYLHPGATKMQCHRDTGLSRVTIDKYWHHDYEEE